MKHTTADAAAVSNAHNTTTTNTSTAVNTGNNSSGNASSLFCEQVNTVTNLFEKWNDCERTVVMYALLKRLRYPSLKFLQYSIDNNLTQNLGSSQSNLSIVVTDINANNSSYLQNLLNAYKTFHLGDMADALSSSSSDKDSMPTSGYGSDFQLTMCDERKLYAKKEDILHEVLNMLPLLKPGNDEAKLIYLALIPVAVKDTMRQIVPTELVQQIFSYLLIHPAITSEDRRSLNVWLRQLEEHIQTSISSSSTATNNSNSNHSNGQAPQNFLPPSNNGGSSNLKVEHMTMMTSGSSTSSSSSSSSASCSSTSNVSMASSMGNLAAGHSSSAVALRNADWQTIAPPSKQHHHQAQQQQLKTLPDWPSVMPTPVGGSSGQLCDNLNGITLNELASSQNSLGLSIGSTLGDSSALVSGVVAAASVSAAPSLFGSNTNPIIHIIHNNNGCSSNMNGHDDHDNSFSKNGTEILDFEPNSNLSSSDSCSHNSGSQTSPSSQPQSLPTMGYASILMNYDQLEMNRWSLDSKMAALKTRRSNSLTTQTISSSSSSSNSSVVTVNDNCSNSTENLAQYANKPRSFSLSIEHQRGALANSGSDTRLDEFKPNYIKFQTRNVGMSSIGLWLKSLRLHKYIELFKNMTYEEMLEISEEYLQSLGVTKGASHKLSLCIEKLKERPHHLAKMEQELLSGQLKVIGAVEELANIVLTPMKPVEMVNGGVVGEDNVALLFLKTIDLVCSIVQKDPYAAQDDENISVIMWILDRSIHNEAFANHGNQLKELKFKISKLKMAITPKMHHVKNGSNGNLNKPRWNGKSRKCDMKNGSNDRINHRKNSNDMLNFSLSCLQQQQQQQQQHPQQQQPQPHHINNHQQQPPQGDFEKFQHMISANGGNNQQQQQQYKSSSYPNFMNNQQHQPMNHQQQQQQQQQQQHHHHQQQIQQQMLQQHAHFPALPQQHPQNHRRSLNNLIVVSGGPQQPQKMVFKSGQGILSAGGGGVATTGASADNLQIENAIKNQQRKASLTGNNNLSATTNADSAQQQQQQQQQQAKKTMAAVVMVSSEDLAAAVANQQQQQQPQQLLINNNNSNMMNNNLICQQQQQQQQQQQHQQQHLLQQQQQQLQLLAAAAAAVGSSCNLNSSNSCLCSSNNSCNSCLSTTYESPLIANINMPSLIKEKYQHHHATTAAAAALNDIKSLEQLETLCLQMTEQAIN